MTILAPSGPGPLKMLKWVYGVTRKLLTGKGEPEDIWAPPTLFREDMSVDKMTEELRSALKEEEEEHERK